MWVVLAHNNNGMTSENLAGHSLHTCCILTCGSTSVSTSRRQGGRNLVSFLVQICIQTRSTQGTCNSHQYATRGRCCLPLFALFWHASLSQAICAIQPPDPAYASCQPLGIAFHTSPNALATTKSKKFKNAGMCGLLMRCPGTLKRLCWVTATICTLIDTLCPARAAVYPTCQ